MRFRLLLCCFGKDHSEADLQVAIAALNSPQAHPTHGQPLCLSILEGPQQGEKLYITPKGLFASLHPSLPVRFGTGEDADYRLGPEEGLEPLHFQIRYDELLGQYQVQDLGAEAGVCVRIDEAMLVEDEMTISFEDVVMELEVLDAKGISVHFIEGEKVGQSMQWRPQDSPIRFGRMADCQVKFEDAGLSRCQCRLFYSNGNWKLQDGDGLKASTNGTWVMVQTCFPLGVKTVFKAGRMLFEAVTADY